MMRSDLIWRVRLLVGLIVLLIITGAVAWGLMNS